MMSACDSCGQDEEEAVGGASSAAAGGGKEEKEEAVLGTKSKGFDTTNEVMHFQTNCPHCNSPCETNMKLVSILWDLL